MEILEQQEPTAASHLLSEAIKRFTNHVLDGAAFTAPDYIFLVENFHIGISRAFDASLKRRQNYDN